MVSPSQRYCPTDNYTTMLTLNQILTPPLIVLLLELVVFAIWFFCLILF
jgi:hypothetical protein